MKIIEADLNNPEHARDIVHLTNQYALDPMGGEEELPGEVKTSLIEGLRNMPTAIIFLAYINGRAAGIANCFFGFSTFSAKKLLYVHDLAVLPEQRGQKIGLNLLKTVENKAREENCSGITLEVLENNPARRLYERFGFDFTKPNYLFVQKSL